MFGQTATTSIHSEPVVSIQQGIFNKGDKIASNNFSGDVWLNMLVPTDKAYNTQIGYVTFAPGARSNWHLHPSGQILLITGGLGYYQEKGKQIQLLHKGDIVKCSPNVIHWHGASPGRFMTHIALSPNMDKRSVVWLGKVTDKDYNSNAPKID
ncbi:cupin domain-containing protein [Mucilaginibacter sp.]|uniref:cupin domain-containing protein n=1 Tax=Mucilaginibacter sp. TaxID=1882438 RepID=UPI002629EC07|nr:cupin domain-containing protein [Mucilaginibacter sp.]MDB5127095.1 cupin protein [Mucilaginibacter sp.]